jgi:hypothetical protein
MRTGKAIALVVALLLAGPAAAAARQGADDEQVRQDAAALPDRLWEPGPEPVSAAGPGLPEDDGNELAPILAVVLLLGAVGAGYVISVRRPSAAPEAAAPAPEPEPVSVAPPTVPAAVPAPLPVAHELDAATETCVVALSHAWGRGRFEVRVKDKGGSHRVVAQSLGFAVPRGMVIQETSAAGRAHRRLLLHLAAAGWQLEPPGDGPWYERRLSRPLAERENGEIDRALVATRPEGAEAEFVALALDEYGNAHVMARSPRFGRPTGRPVEETEPAVAAHGTLLEGLEAHGWHVSGTLQSWYGATLARRRRRPG